VTASDRLFGYEALVRSRDPRFPGPGPLFAAAASLGREADLARAIRTRAPEPFLGRPDPTRLFVNLARADLEDARLGTADDPLAAIAPRVVLEVTEKLLLDGTDAVDRLRHLRGLGFRLAVDDFGTEGSSISRTLALRPDYVKLDRSLVRYIDRRPSTRRLVGAVCTSLAEDGTCVLGEGVERAEERDTLLGFGVELFQGFLFGRPEPDLRPGGPSIGNARQTRA
jgi:EAL domain-containing protein (putative c-di-GMP-specific phosphodiesterase class I)